MDTSDDADLMLRFQRAHDYTAFERLFLCHKDGLLRFLVRLTGERTTAEDVSQHTWLKVIDVARRGTFEARSGVLFRTWLFTLARNHYVDEYRRKAIHSRRTALTDELAEEADSYMPRPPNPVDVLHDEQISEQLDRALRELPFEQREVIVLWAAGVELDMMATMIDAPRDTILSRKKYALAKLRAAMVPARAAFR